MPLRLVPRRHRRLYRITRDRPDRTVPRGRPVPFPDDGGPGVVLVRRGHLCLRDAGGGTGTAPTSPGRTLAVAAPGELVLDAALEGGGATGPTPVSGESPTVVRWLPRDEVLACIRGSRVTRNDLLEALARDLALARRLLAGSRGPDAAGRLAAVLLDLVRRSSPSGEVVAGARLALRPTHATLGDLAGLHRSTVTTLLGDWSWRGWIADGDGGLHVVDPHALGGRTREPGRR